MVHPMGQGKRQLPKSRCESAGNSRSALRNLFTRTERPLLTIIQSFILNVSVAIVILLALFGKCYHFETVHQ